MTESLSMEVKSFNITVTLVEPGDFNTEMRLNQIKSVLPEDSVYKENQKDKLGS